jgi:uncharacterized protein (DUF427 family)
MTETLARPAVPDAEDRARLKEGVHVERSPRRVRTYFGGKLIADSEHVLLVYETKRPPAYWFAVADVRMEYLEQSQQSGDIVRWRLVVKDRIAHNAVRAYVKPTGGQAALEEHLTFSGMRWMRGSRRTSASSFIVLEQLTRIGERTDPDEICPVLSVQSADARRGDNIINALGEFLFDRYDVDTRDILRATEIPSNYFEA